MGISVATRIVGVAALFAGACTAAPTTDAGDAALHDAADVINRDDTVDVMGHDDVSDTARVDAVNDANANDTCVPSTCGARNCDTVDDGCGHTIPCGTCTAPETCGGGGTANVCGRPAPRPGLHYYVATTGNDSNDGSEAHPWRTIGHADSAITVGPEGTTVHVAPGTYSGDIQTRRNGTASARVAFVSDVRWGAVLETTTWFVQGSYVDVIGFEFRGAGRSEALGVYGSFTRVLGNFVHDMGTGCASTGAIVMPPNGYLTSHDNEASGNIVRNLAVGTTGCNQYHGIYLAGDRMIARNNVISGVPGWGVHLWHAATRAVITNNTIFENRQGGIIVGGDDSEGVVNDYTTVSNNIVVNNGADAHFGIFEFGPSLGTHNAYLNNVVYANRPSDFSIASGAMPTGTVTLNATSFGALFVDYRADGTGDYRLQAGSGAIDVGSTMCAMGVTGCAPTVDLEGGARRVGAMLDAGAYEFGAAPAAWPFW